MKRQKGFAFIEVVISLAIIGVVAVAFLGGLATASNGLLTADERETAKNLAEAQMEYVKNRPYSVSYSPSTDILDEYDGYDVTISTTSLQDDGNIQKITITVDHDLKAELITLENYKVHK